MTSCPNSRRLSRIYPALNRFLKGVSNFIELFGEESDDENAGDTHLHVPTRGIKRGPSDGEEYSHLIGDEDNQG